MPINVSFKLNQYINVTLWSIVPASYRSVDTKRLDVQLVQLGAIGADQFYDGVAGHCFLELPPYNSDGTLSLFP